MTAPPLVEPVRPAATAEPPRISASSPEFRAFTARAKPI